MASENSTFKVKELRVGFPLQYDLTRIDGRPLAKAGEIVTPQVLADWADEGIESAIAITGSGQAQSTRIADEVPTGSTNLADSSSELLQLYDEQALQRLDLCFTKASTATLQIVELLAADQLEDCTEIAGTIEEFMAEVDLDIGTVLASLAGQQVDLASDNDTQLAKRCAKLAMLGMVASKAMGLNEAECQMVGLVGMLHDVSLFDQTQIAVEKIYGVHADAEQRYLEHPLQSASLLTYVGGVSEQIRHIVSQVHEEPNGFGFPRGLIKHRIHPSAKILNLVDAYLTLISSDQPQRLPQGMNLLPADAIAYLMHHVGQGHFDVAAAKALVRATSLYPVGSLVELSDETLALVVRSSQSSPFEPIVRRDEGTGSVVDLRHSGLSVVRPCGSQGSRQARMSSSKLDNIFWR